MIVRDEERVLARCLDSVAGVVDEICIADTGSQDRTREIARERGARVVEVDWSDDFAAARNASLELATGDWILVLDADEVISSPDARRSLEAFIERHPQRTGQVRIDDEGNAAAGLEASTTWITRFFPRAQRPSFEGRIHEQLLLDGREAERAPTSLTIRHDGYTAEAIDAKGKLTRNANLLKQVLLESPEDPYLWWHLGRTRAVAGDQEAALEAFSHALRYVDSDVPYVASLCESACYALRALDRSPEALQLISSIADVFEDRADTLFLAALLSMDVGRFDDAESGFQACLALADQPPPRGGPSSRAAATSAAAYNLGVLREVLGRTAEARECYRQALAFDPQHAPSRGGLMRLDTN